MLKKSSLGAVAEVAAVIVIAAVVGTAWNHRLLINAWRGEPAAAAAVQVTAPAVASQNAQDALPLPLGLMQVKELHDAGEAILVDARDAETFAAGHLKGAVSLPLGVARQRQAAFAAMAPKEKSIIVYCNGFSCHDSMDLGKILIGWGYPTVYVYEGGFPEWQDAGYPVERGGQR